MADLKMPELNYVHIVGNLTKDPIYRTTSNNTPVVNFSIASNRRYRDRMNTWQEDVCYVGIVAWNRLAESCNQRLKKGSAVLVEGELQTRNWKSDDGSHRSVLEIKARRIQFLNKTLKTNGNGYASEDMEISSFSEDDDLFEFFDESDHNIFNDIDDGLHQQSNTK
jgi:single-strand DNA-binding protein